jgi:hypothetical protein
MVVRPHECFDVIHEIIEGDERQLGFEMREFAQVAASVTLGVWGRISTRDLYMQNCVTCSLL